MAEQEPSITHASTTTISERRGHTTLPDQIQGVLDLSYRRVDVNVDIESRQFVENRQVIDMTPMAAETQKAIARSQFEVPEHEQTKRAQEMTKWETQFTIRHSMVVVAVVTLAILVYLNHNAAAGIAALGAVLGGVYLGTTYIEKKLSGAKKGETTSEK